MSRAGNVVTVLLLAAALVMSGLMTAGAVEPRQRAERLAVPLNASPAPAIAMEKVKLSGRLPTKGRRPVVLQRKVGGGWEKVADKRSSAKGRFVFKVRAAKAGAETFRVTAPSSKVDGQKLPAVTTKRRTVRTVAQQAQLELPESTPVNREFVVRATFTPARPGRKVLVQELRDGDWVTLASTSQDTDGVAVAELVGLTEGRYEYRAVAKRRKGAPAFPSAKQTLTVVKDQTEVSDTAEPLSAEERQAISDFDLTTGQLVFGDTAPATVAEIEPGDVVPVPPRPGAPSGALVTVLEKTTEGGNTILTTTPAAIPEVIENTPDDESEVALPVTEVPEVTPLTDGISVEVVDEGVEGDGLLPRAKRLEVSATTLTGPKQKISIDKEFKQTDGGRTTSVIVTGSLSLAPVIDMAVDVDWWTVKSYKLGTGFQVDDKLKIHGSATFQKGWSQELFTVSSQHAGAIGPVPVWVTVTGTVSLVATATGQITAQYTWHRSGRSVVGIKGTKDGGYVPRRYHENPTTSSELLIASAVGTLRGAVVASLQADLYSVGGPFGTLGYEAVATIQQPVDKPLTCELYHRPTASIGLRSGALISKFTGGKPATFAEYRHNFKKNVESACPKPPPPPPADPPVITTGSLPDGTVGVEYAGELEVQDDRDGTWTVDGLPAGLALDETTGRVTGTPTADGASVLDVEFTDADGLTDSAQVGLTIHPEDSDPVPPTIWRSIEGRWGTSCGVRGDDTGWCWGENNRGQVGDGSLTQRLRPVQLPGTWLEFTLGGYNTCGIQTDRSGWCWGNNATGSLGDGTTTDRLSPTRLPGTWKTIVMSNSTTCGIQTDDSGWCWGWDGHGQLGDGSPGSTKLSPVRLPGSWKSLEINHAVVCGVRTDDTGWCWGENGEGAVGDGTTTDRYAPVQLPGHWTSIHLADGSVGATCGIRTDGTGWCWGANTYGQVGDGTVVNRLQPFQLPGTWTQVAPGGRLTCGVQTDETGWCWGRNSSGQLGDGTTIDRHHPVQLPGSWRTIEMDFNLGVYACGIRPDGAAACWGANSYGQLGNGTTVGQASPSPLAGTWERLDLGFGYTCGVRTDTTGWCFGANSWGQLGDGTTTNRPSPVNLP